MILPPWNSEMDYKNKFIWFFQKKRKKTTFFSQEVKYDIYRIKTSYKSWFLQKNIKI